MTIQLNEHFAALSKNYLFSEIARRVRKYQQSHPDANIIKMGIGDITRPLPECVVSAMKKAADELGNADTFRGYPPEYGYDFLREAISIHYSEIGVKIPIDDIFVSDGAKSDCGNFVDVMGDNDIYLPDPVYPVYRDSNIMSGHRITLLPSGRENDFLPMPNAKTGTGVYYLCSPGNPTGAAYSAEQLAEWVSFALESGSLILFDAAYEAFITDNNCPRSIYLIPGARACAVEICSFSKTAGFTGTRCGYTVVPAQISANGVCLRDLWARRQATKFNGVSYPVQRAAQAAYSPQGMAACYENIAYYRKNAAMLASVLDEKGIYYTGGKNSPYLWLQCPGGMASWDFFDYLLEKANLVGTPGEGFGKCGEGFFRLTSFSTHELTEQAVRRLREVL